MLPQTGHCSVHDKATACAFDITYPNPTPTDVIATTSGKCPKSQIEYTPISSLSEILSIQSASGQSSQVNSDKNNSTTSLNVQNGQWGGLNSLIWTKTQK
jgi:hypothetical protein